MAWGCLLILENCHGEKRYEGMQRFSYRLNRYLPKFCSLSIYLTVGLFDFSFDVAANGNGEGVPFAAVPVGSRFYVDTLWSELWAKDSPMTAHNSTGGRRFSESQLCILERLPNQNNSNDFPRRQRAKPLKNRFAGKRSPVECVVPMGDSTAISPRQSASSESPQTSRKHRKKTNANTRRSAIGTR
jgi:hypothetical protein